MIVAAKSLLGKGAYTPAEAAFYARVKTQTLNRWLFGDGRGQSVVVPEVGEPDDEKIVTFLDFVQALAIRAIRSRHKITLTRIRQAVEIAQENNIQYPFAVAHTTYLFSDQQDQGHGDIVLEIDGKLLQASGTHRKNYVMREIAELYMCDLHFDEQTGLANKYDAWVDQERGKIVMDPRVRFGEPYLETCGHTAETLWDAYQVEGGITPAARAFDVEDSDIELALLFYDHLISVDAA